MDRRRFLTSAAAASATAALGVSPALAADPSDTVVFLGGPIQSLTPRGRLSAVAIRGDRIVAVGEGAQALLERGARRVDLSGRALYPGFIDAHSHWFGNWDLAAQGNPEWSDVRSPVDSLQRAVASGWTTITEHFASNDRLNGLRGLDASGLLPVNVNAYMPANWGFEDFGTWYLAYEPDTFLGPRVRIAGVKLFVDGGRPFAREPYEPCEGAPAGFRGRFFWDRDVLERRMTDIDRAGYQITVHCFGDAAADILIDILSRIDPAASNPRRHNLTHLILLHDEQIERLRRQRIVADIQLSWFHGGDAERYTCMLGSERVRGIGRWRDLLAAGVPMTGSTDFPFAPSPIIGPVLRTLYTATTRIGPHGESPAPWMSSQTLSTSQAISLLTTAAAWALRQEHLRGALRPGMLADLVVFSQDPLGVRAEDLLDIEVAMTVVGGRVEHIHADHGDLRAATA